MAKQPTVKESSAAAETAPETKTDNKKSAVEFTKTSKKGSVDYIYQGGKLYAIVNGKQLYKGKYTEKQLSAFQAAK